MGSVWDGINGADALSEAERQVRHSLADAAKAYDWKKVVSVLRDRPELVNTTRPGGSSLYAPLHQAAHGGADRETVEKLIGLGAWRTLQNARGERPADVATRCGHRHLLGILEPELKRHVPYGVLLKTQAHLHEVILGRAARQVQDAGLRMPELEPLLEFESHDVWFAVPAMYGGFSYRLQSEGVEAILISESWYRIVEGSGQRHQITSAGSRMVDEGFV